MRKLIIILCLFASLPAYSQSKADIGMYVCSFIAGGADGANQAIALHHVGAGHPFWDYATSWKNKYKDFDGGDLRSAFPFSKNILVGLTDGYHLTRSINRAFTLGSLTLALSDKHTFKSIVYRVLTCAVANRAGFVLMYNVVLPRKK